MTEPFRLDGRVALVTGAGSERGIGREVARTFARAGARVALADLDGDGARRNAEELGAAAIGLAVDVTDAVSVTAAVGEAERRISAGSRPTSAQWPSSTSDLCTAVSSGPPGKFQTSACSATTLSVFRSPPPPIQIGG